MTADNNGSDDTNKSQLLNFTTRHTSHHTPIALVTSGGTSAPLEHNCVRFLDNFSTGTRGAHAVEQFLSRGYAVIHLKRTGSVSPFGRLLNDALECGKEGLTLDTFGKLFDAGLSGDGGLDLDVDDYLNHNKKAEGNDDSQECPDPWLYSKCDQNNSSSTTSSNRRRRGELSLNHRLVNSTTLQATIRTYKHIHQQGLLLTINFETVDDYLQKLQLCSEAISIAGPLGLVYLAAAVSDFYIPTEKRTLHKIQSRDYGIKSQASSASNLSSASEEENTSGDNNMQVQSDNTLTLTLYPVPKIIPTLRKVWCPNAFVVGFKLETDPSILRQKSVIAMEKNNVHLVIGNELATRYEKVFVLSRGGSDIDLADDDDVAVRNNGCEQYGASELPDGYHVSEVTAAHGVAMSSVGMNEGRNKNDALEYATIEYVVRHHFHYISTDVNISDGLNQKPTPAELVVETTLKAKKIHDERLEAQYHQMQRERLKARVVDFAWSAAGSVLGMAISYGIGRMLSGRQQQYGAYLTEREEH